MHCSERSQEYMTHIWGKEIRQVDEKNVEKPHGMNPQIVNL